MTPKKLLSYIERYKKKHGYAPSMAEIARHFGCTRQNVRKTYFNKMPELRQFPEYGRYYNK